MATAQLSKRKRVCHSLLDPQESNPCPCDNANAILCSTQRLITLSHVMGLGTLQFKAKQNKKPTLVEGLIDPARTILMARSVPTFMPCGSPQDAQVARRGY